MMENQAKENRIFYKVEDFVCKIGNGLSLKHAKGDGYYLARNRALGMGFLTLFSTGATISAVFIFENVVYSNHAIGPIFTLFLTGVLVSAAFLGNTPGTRLIARVLRMGLLVTLTVVVAYASEFIAVLPNLSYDLGQQSLKQQTAIYQPLDSLDRIYHRKTDSLNGQVAKVREKLQSILERQSVTQSSGQAGLKQQQGIWEQQLEALEDQLGDLKDNYEHQRESLVIRIEQEQLPKTEVPMTALDNEVRMNELQKDKKYAEGYAHLSLMLMILSLIAESLWGVMKLTERKNAFDYWAMNAQQDQMQLEASTRKVLYKQIQLFESLSEVALRQRDFQGLRMIEEELNLLRKRMEGDH